MMPMMHGSEEFCHKHKKCTGRSSLQCWALRAERLSIGTRSSGRMIRPACLHKPNSAASPTLYSRQTVVQQQHMVPVLCSAAASAMHRGLLQKPVQQAHAARQNTFSVWAALYMVSLDLIILMATSVPGTGFCLSLARSTELNTPLPWVANTSYLPSMISPTCPAQQAESQATGLQDV